MKRIFVWDAHPHASSLCSALADAYVRGAERAGAEVRRLALADMDFEGSASRDAMLEPDLVAWQEALTWSTHVLVVHPYWWGGMPSRAKAVLERALVQGFGFRYADRGLGFERLLKGRTADIVITSDTPPWFDSLVFGASGRRVLRRQVLGLCGIRTRRALQFGPVRTASPERIATWIDRVERLGASAAGD